MCSVSAIVDGTFRMFIETDPAATNRIKNVSSFMENAGAVAGSVRLNHSCDAPLLPLNMRRPLSTQPSLAEPHSYIICSAYCYTTGTEKQGGEACGELYLDYDVDLMVPNMKANIWEKLTEAYEFYQQSGSTADFVSCDVISDDCKPALRDENDSLVTMVAGGLYTSIAPADLSCLKLGTHTVIRGERLIWHPVSAEFDDTGDAWVKIVTSTATMGKVQDLRGETFRWYLPSSDAFICGDVYRYVPGAYSS
jgi:hypothetical protein